MTWYIRHDNISAPDTPGAPDNQTGHPDTVDIYTPVTDGIVTAITSTVPRDIIDTVINPFLQHTVAPLIRAGLALSS